MLHILIKLLLITQIKDYQHIFGTCGTNLFSLAVTLNMIINIMINIVILLLLDLYFYFNTQYNIHHILPQDIKRSKKTKVVSYKSR